jgi:PBP1b-binding outer membrane lipoprotein LpoB
MRTFFGVLLLILVLSSCTNNEASTKAKVDSTVETLDSAAKAIFDSAKQDVKDIRDHLDTTFDKKFDKKK